MRGYKPLPLKAVLAAGQANPGSTVLHDQEGANMRHKIKVRVNPEADSVVKVCQVSLRKRLARRIFGTSERYAVLVPGGSVDEVTIIEQPDDLMALAEAVGVAPSGGDRE